MIFYDFEYKAQLICSKKGCSKNLEKFLLAYSKVYQVIQF